MRINNRLDIWLARLGLLALITALFLVAAPLAAGQTANEQLAQTAITGRQAESADESQVIFSEYRGIKIGMTAQEVRTRIDQLRAKGEIQDFFVLSDTETAQVFYDKDGRVRAISIDYMGKHSNAPTPMQVFGKDIQPRTDGSMYERASYPSLGFWISYHRTAGEDPTVTITMQRSLAD